MGDELEFSCVEDIQDGGLVLGIFVADLDKLLLKFGPFGAEEYGTGGVGLLTRLALLENVVKAAELAK